MNSSPAAEINASSTDQVPLIRVETGDKPLEYKDEYAEALTSVLEDPNKEVSIVGLVGRLGCGKKQLIDAVFQRLRASHQNQFKKTLSYKIDDRSAFEMPLIPRDVDWQYEICGGRMVGFIKHLMFLCLAHILVVYGVSAAVIAYFYVKLSNPDLVTTTRTPLQTPAMDDPFIESTNASITYMNTTSMPMIISADQPTYLTTFRSSDPTTSPPEFLHEIHQEIFTALEVVLIIICVTVAVLLTICCCCERSKGETTSKMFWWRYFKIIVVLCLCKFPAHGFLIKLKGVQFIPIRLNAWDYAGESKNNLWAAILEEIFNKVEKKFGKFTTRLYRISSPYKDKDDAEIKFSERDIEAEESVSDSTDPLKIKVKPASKCGIGYPELIAIALSINTLCILVLIFTIPLCMSSDTRTTSISLQAVSGIIIGSTLLSQITKIKDFVVKMFSSQKQRVNALKKKASAPDFAEHKGYVQTLKKSMDNLLIYIRCMEYLYVRRFRILLIIDDLDRCGEDTIMQIADVLTVLLSDKRDPIMCMVSLDGESFAKALSGKDCLIYGIPLRSQNNGYVQMDQLIEMKFCMPTIYWNTKEIKEALQRPSSIESEEISLKAISKENLHELRVRMLSDQFRPRDHEAILERSGAAKMRLVHSIYLGIRSWALAQVKIGDDKIKLHRVKELASWLILCEQWPYRMSWILYSIEKKGNISSISNSAETNTDETNTAWTLFQHYDNVKPWLCDPHLDGWADMIELDETEDAFLNALNHPFNKYEYGDINIGDIKSSLIKSFLPFTVNLDRSFRDIIERHMEIEKLNSYKTKLQH